MGGAERDPRARRPERSQRSTRSPEWEAFLSWRHQMTPQVRRQGVMHGQSPEGTPEIFPAIEQRLTAEDHLMGGIFGYPPIEEVLARPADYAQQQAEAARQQERRRLAIAVNETEKPELSIEKLRERHSERFPGGLTQQIDEMLSSALSATEQEVLKLRFGLSDGRQRTQAETARAIERSPRTVRRIEKRAFQKLRSPELKERMKTIFGE